MSTPAQKVQNQNTSNTNLENISSIDSNVHAELSQLTEDVLKFDGTPDDYELSHSKVTSQEVYLESEHLSQKEKRDAETLLRKEISNLESNTLANKHLVDLKFENLIPQLQNELGNSIQILQLSTTPEILWNRLEDKLDSTTDEKLEYSEIASVLGIKEDLSTQEIIQITKLLKAISSNARSEVDSYMESRDKEIDSDTWVGKGLNWVTKKLTNGKSLSQWINKPTSPPNSEGILGLGEDILKRFTKASAVTVSGVARGVEKLGQSLIGLVGVNIKPGEPWFKKPDIINVVTHLPAALKSIVTPQTYVNLIRNTKTIADERGLQGVLMSLGTIVGESLIPVGKIAKVAKASKTAKRINRVVQRAGEKYPYVKAVSNTIGKVNDKVDDIRAVRQAKRGTSKIAKARRELNGFAGRVLMKSRGKKSKNNHDQTPDINGPGHKENKDKDPNHNKEDHDPISHNERREQDKERRDAYITATMGATLANQVNQKLEQLNPEDYDNWQDLLDKVAENSSKALQAMVSLIAGIPSLNLLDIKQIRSNGFEFSVNNGKQSISCDFNTGTICPANAKDSHLSQSTALPCHAENIRGCQVMYSLIEGSTIAGGSSSPVVEFFKKTRAVELEAFWRNLYPTNNRITLNHFETKPWFALGQAPNFDQKMRDWGLVNQNDVLSVAGARDNSARVRQDLEAFRVASDPNSLIEKVA